MAGTWRELLNATIQAKITDPGTAFAALLLGKFPDGSAAAPMGYLSDPDTGPFRQGTNAYGIATAGVEVARFDASATATHTRFLIYDVDNATLERVTVGAADSGGAGFKVLRIPN